MQLDLNVFAAPTAAYRAKPFWALNGRLKKEELRFQIGCMKKMGFGGAFLHSRTGLETEYMSEEWLDLISYAADVLHENGMEAYLYDEDRWPSGTCGGYVTEKKEFRQKSMVCEKTTAEESALGASDGTAENILGLFAVRLDGEERVVSCRRIAGAEAASADEKLFSVRFLYMQSESFYNGYTYVDTLNRAATDEFIRLTHEKYKAAMGGKFGKEIVGIFTDEPHRGPFLNGFSHKEAERFNEIPYTYDLFRQFEKRKGYKIEERLPLLWMGRSGTPFCKETYDFIEVVQQLFLENYAKPCYDWCRENRIVFTGHILHEDNLASQTTMSGSVMRFYEYMDYPGMDNLGELNYCYNVPALVNSVAKQLGKEFVLDELYGATGWQMRFADYKHTGDWQSAGGVSLRCPHLSWYTMKGEAKRDYPASFLHQSAWYKDFSVVEDYFSRLQYLLKCGEDETDVAVINPVETTWGLSDRRCYENSFSTKNPLYRKIEGEYAALYKGLWLRGLCVDYIDEGLFEKYGRTENGLFICGKKKYKKVVLNGNLCLRSGTLSALRAFLSDGGSVLIVGEGPCWLDGELYDFSDALRGAEKIAFDPDAAYEKLKDGMTETGDRRLIVVRRKVGTERLIFLLNSSRTEEFSASVRIGTALGCEQLDLRTGERRGIVCRREGEYLVVEKRFARGEELMLRLTADALPPQKEAIYEPVALPESFAYRLDEPDYLVLDNAEFSIEGEGQGRDYVLNIDRKLRRRFALETRSGEMIQPWFKRKFFFSVGRKYARVRLDYRFFAEYRPSRLSLMLENGKKTSVYLNGTEAKGKITRTELDSAFDLLPLPAERLKEGENILSVEFDFYEETNVEGVFLVGEFGVRRGKKEGEDVLIPLPAFLKPGDLCKQGLPYYGGGVELYVPSAGKGEYKLKTDDVACALVRVNGAPMAFPPYESKFSADGSGVITIRAVMTRNNLFGCSDENGAHSRILPQGLIAPLKLFRKKLSD